MTRPPVFFLTSLSLVQCRIQFPQYPGNRDLGLDEEGELGIQDITRFEQLPQECVVNLKDASLDLHGASNDLFDLGQFLRVFRQASPDQGPDILDHLLLVLLAVRPD